MSATVSGGHGSGNNLSLIFLKSDTKRTVLSDFGIINVGWAWLPFGDGFRTPNFTRRSISFF